MGDVIYRFYKNGKPYELRKAQGWHGDPEGHARAAEARWHGSGASQESTPKAGITPKAALATFLTAAVFVGIPGGKLLPKAAGNVARKALARVVPKIAFKRTLKVGGATIALSGKSPKKGFALSPYKSREAVIPRDQFKPEHVSKFVEQNKDLLDKPGHHIGTWHDKESGNVFLDISVVSSNLDQAKDLARQHKQLAIFDLKEGKEISLS